MAKKANEEKIKKMEEEVGIGGDSHEESDAYEQRRKLRRAQQDGGATGKILNLI